MYLKGLLNYEQKEPIEVTVQFTGIAANVFAELRKNERSNNAGGINNVTDQRMLEEAVIAYLALIQCSNGEPEYDTVESPEDLLDFLKHAE